MSEYKNKEQEETACSRDEILDNLQQMLNSEDYKQLASVISDSVNKALNYTKKSVKCGEYQTKKAIKAIKMQANNVATDFLKKENPSKLAPVAKTPAGTYSGPLVATGAVGCLVVGSILLITTLLGGFNLFSLIIPGIFLAFGTTLAIKSRNLMGQVSRFKTYLKYIDLSKPSIPTEDLAKLSNRSKHYIQRDLSKMINLKMFLEGHLSEDGNLLLLTDSAYQDHLDFLNNQKIKQEENRKKQELENEKPVYKEIHKIVDEGAILVQKIKSTNQLIIDKKVQKKIEKLIDIINRIFLNVQKHPENLSDIRRLMSYYLPTTEKIIKAYQELEVQPVQGNNIVKTKQEIIDSLDTIIQAFETLYDSLYKSKSDDITSDISVMKTMFSREGLTNNDNIHN